MNYGYQQQPRPKGTSALKVLGIIFGSIAVLSLGTCAVCVGAVKKAGKDAEKAAASAQASASQQGATFVPTLAKLAADPKSGSPTSTKPGKDETVYAYGDPAGTPLHGLQLTVGKDKGLWGFEFSAAPDIVAKAFGDVDRAEADTETVWSVGDGPLKGAVVVQQAQRWQVMSVAYAMKTIAGGEKLNAWLCSTKRVPGRNATTTSEFKVQCEDMVRKKLLSPREADFPGMFERSRVITSTACDLTWMSWVDTKNAFGVKIRHNFVCKYDEGKQSVSIELTK